jgi:hypothetical protein
MWKCEHIPVEASGPLIRRFHGVEPPSEEGKLHVAQVYVRRHAHTCQMPLGVPRTHRGVLDINNHSVTPTRPFQLPNLNLKLKLSVVLLSHALLCAAMLR